jgi:DNA-directed RNA polymerase specialized sigma24 family protein
LRRAGGDARHNEGQREHAMSRDSEKASGTPLESGDDSSKLAAFEQHRGLLFSIAYRMLGSVADAEDTLQDAFIRC